MDRAGRGWSFAGCSSLPPTRATTTPTARSASRARLNAVQVRARKFRWCGGVITDTYPSRHDTGLSGAVSTSTKASLVMSERALATAAVEVVATGHIADEVRQLIVESPTNLHDAAAVIMMDPKQKHGWRLSALVASVAIVVLQIAAVTGVVDGVHKATCRTHAECNDGQYCDASRRTCAFCSSPDFCSESDDARDTAAARWEAAREVNDDYEWQVASTYAAHCEGCFDQASNVYTSTEDATAYSVSKMRLPDWCTLCFASLIVALCVANELHDIQMCAALRRKAVIDSQHCTGWHVALWVLEALRRFGVLPFLTGGVSLIVVVRGSDALSICLNAVAMCFLLDIDDQLYHHGASERLRQWCATHARPIISDVDRRAMDWSRVAMVLSTWLGIVASIAAYYYSREAGEVMPFALTVLPSIAEAAAYRSPRRFGGLLLQAVVGLGATMVYILVVLGTLRK